jgi:hypothetical protein
LPFWLQPAFIDTSDPNGDFDMDVGETHNRVVASVSKEQFSGLIAAANSGEPLALAELRRTLAGNPSISANLGDVAAMVERGLCQDVIKHDAAMGEIIAHKANQLRQSLIAGARSPIVHLAADRVVISWLATNVLDLKYADISGMSPPEGNLIVKQKTAAERRHLAAIRTLSQVRALVEPPGQESRRQGGQSQQEDSLLGVVG